jgi:hypothetical protein
LYIQFYFKSFFKIQFSAPTMQYNINRNTANITTINAQIILFALIYFQRRKVLNQGSNTTEFWLSNFSLPTRKHSIIFLRAPYKNKLARLNIVNIEYKCFFVLKTPDKLINNKPSMNFLRISKHIEELQKFNISSMKLKHVKTRLCISNSYVENFHFEAFTLTV